ncbi:DUF4232 domain-containing protein [Streptomyces griseocarneus]|uniref:DUF4232 domain-containing protein n=1 Tax=Streptomyces griseocarneus TaxID=51201 RepID=UPI00167E51A2|nr:DUF4232 domain-containing protein [Streptomyces griseocarneus]MBZ6475004.1 DUF4232 domain-containing protein [Streptomyces griseocarneus]GHG62832.1 hypothetical protein GCM10018779_31900 [Streptomyces griseocarneus]
MRAFHTRTTTVLAATATAVLALTLTACGEDGSGTKSSGPAADTAASAPSSAQSAQGTASGKNGGTARGAGTAKASTGQAVASTPVCTAKNVSISAAYQGGPPYTHIVLTAKNTSGHSCKLNGFPEIQFLESHRENVPPVAKSKPATPVVLTAGAPAYAVVKVSDGGREENTEPVTAFSVTLQGGGGMAAVKAPGGGIAVDPAKWATGYWTHELRNGADDF